MTTVRSTAVRRVPARRALAVLACLAALAASVPPALADTATPTQAPPASVDADPAVIGAESDLSSARQRAAELAAQLDTAAAAYERSRAHHERVSTEFEESPAAGATAESAEKAKAAAAEAAASAYKRPRAPMVVTEALLRSDDVVTALRRAELLSQVAEGGESEAERAAQVAHEMAEQAADRRVIVAGLRAAVESHRRQAVQLTAELDAARDAVASAETAVDEARREANARIGAAATTAEAAVVGGEPTDSTRRRSTAPAGASSPRGTAPAGAPSGVVAGGALPSAVIAGRTCPVAQPNGFIDSWGYPRSGGRSHKGVDMFAAHGTPLFAVADGTVRKVGTNSLGGLSIHLVDTNGDRFYYAHLSAASVVTGQAVRVGQVIGAVGDSGNAKGTPPHLHWEYHPGDGPAVNPYPLARSLCRESGTGA